ncbi:ABC transporter ATP-binding protein [Actibacterium pelagium]|uniref:ABC transporter ATP-binding protein n=1 Tax=Actibacterium pelagium TaxID=2029103 RepID=A0A917ENZ4_9RHOB|nr:dipeptide ABC transporter ATP-binding protein [Actibacterium pelagium]GGE61495.1 ABC transporter ATP-binding protein [Actibacterium pelagium]
MSLLSIQDLSLSIHGTPILDRVSIDIEPGEVCGVIGESGSGKSLTAFSVMQLLPDGAVCSGAIRLAGTDILQADEQALCNMRGKTVGMVFQEPMTALNPVQTIGQQVAETIRIHRKTSRAEAMALAAESLARCELPQDRFPLSRYPHELSGGQRQRVVIAMAIALRPKLLIADEPTTALDVTTQAEILSLLKQLVTEDGMGLMLITHDLAVVTDIADHIVIMKTGEVVERGRAETLHREMQHPYTKALFEASTHQPETAGQIEDTVLLSVKNVVRDYTGARTSLFAKPTPFRAVNDVSFNLHKGECLGLVGESGCGKSTLTRAILGLDDIQGGSIKLNGLDVHADESARQQMQVVFQDPYGSFNPRHKVGRLVSEPFFRLGRQATDDEIADSLISVGLKATDQDKYIHEFSGGQRQRIAIARALIIKPDLIILDEAVSALDVSIRAQILDLLAELSSERGLTYLFITHDLTVVKAIADRVLVMQGGQIIEQGETETVFSAPQQDYTKKLIAAAPELPSLEGVSA